MTYLSIFTNVWTRLVVGLLLLISAILQIIFNVLTFSQFTKLARNFPPTTENGVVEDLTFSLICLGLVASLIASASFSYLILIFRRQVPKFIGISLVVLTIFEFAMAFAHTVLMATKGPGLSDPRSGINDLLQDLQLDSQNATLLSLLHKDVIDPSSTHYIDNWAAQALTALTWIVALLSTLFCIIENRAKKVEKRSGEDVFIMLEKTVGQKMVSKEELDHYDINRVNST